MYYLIRLFAGLFLSILLVSCASIDQQDSIVDLPGSYRYAAWRLQDTQSNEAINVLLDEADVLIEQGAHNAAIDKLERVLRIRPEYAPAWSRLSWLALESNSPKRSVQMAKRSNSFAFSNTELQTLNWSFIRDASKALNDTKTYQRANQKIESLKAF